ncbi:uncharacterized protein LOC130629784 isoform X2 [Hydractinia symbiolongicarpus]|uniref:uncharacterized protein LOC130629784 isoform X2 n=1 Tax=Hydractinia symbiolongicarpus TaxID=13093 RepID=UPI00254E298D|nr:uncharacterized protein LOC130629784 isoform X2 [Hydractinia symbiolongicarpus]
MKQNGAYVKADEEMSFPVSAGDSDDDSDAKQLFELPKRKIIRPPSSVLKRKMASRTTCWSVSKKCCSVLVTTALPIVLAIFIVSMILCVAMLLIAFSNMRSDMEVLKVKLNNVKDSEATFLNRKEKLRSSFQTKLEKIKQHEDIFQKLQDKINDMSQKIGLLVDDVNKLKKNPVLTISSKIDSLVHDLDRIKTGMADTGADIEELKANEKKDKDDLLQLKQDVYKIQKDVYNLTVDLSRIENKPRPSLTSTPKTLVVTMMPDKEMPVKRAELTKILADLKAKQLEVLATNNLQCLQKVDELRNGSRIAATTHKNDITELRTELKWLKDNYKTLLKEHLKVNDSNVTVRGDQKNTETENLNATVLPPSTSISINKTRNVVTSLQSTPAPIIETTNTKPVTNVNVTHNTPVIVTTGIPLAKSIEALSKHKRSENTDIPITNTIDEGLRGFDHLESLPDGGDTVDRGTIPKDEEGKKKYLHSLSNIELQKLLLNLKRNEQNGLVGPSTDEDGDVNDDRFKRNEDERDGRSPFDN